MAPKFQILPHRPATEEKKRESSSDEEEDEEESSGEENSADETEEGSSEDEEDTKTLNKPQIPVSKPQSEQTQPTIESASESESSSDSESEDTETLNTDKPQVPVPKPQSNQTPRKVESASDSESDKLQPVGKPSTPSSVKRSQRELDTSPDPTSNKKLKAEEKTPSAFVRLWSETDEITVLKGMIEFRKKEGQDTNSEGFYNFIKGKLQDNFSKEQLRTKIGRMKKRYVTAMKKAENGSEPVFSKPHERMSFELSKMIWGEIISNGPLSSKKDKTPNVKKNKIENNVGKAEKVAVQSVMNEENGEEEDFWSKYPNLSLSFKNIVGNFPPLAMAEAGTCYLKERMSLIGNAKAKEFDEKWRQLIVEEAELKYKMLSLMTEQVRVALNK